MVKASVVAARLFYVRIEAAVPILLLVILNLVFIVVNVIRLFVRCLLVRRRDNKAPVFENALFRGSPVRILLLDVKKTRIISGKRRQYGQRTNYSTGRPRDWRKRRKPRHHADERRIAEAAGLDLVVVSPKAELPVCRAIDYGK